ncbi:MAG TPA: LamG domain-containing protein [Solirubrobacterales bacterium]|nr:LamG domain-containing protein [Solirubrobacterales bacterium]
MRRSTVAATLRGLVLGCCLLGALLAAPAAQAAAPLLGQWSLNGSHASGPTESTDDASGNGLALTSAVGAMKFGTAEGKFGGYLANASATNLQVTSPLLAPQRITLLAWIKQNGNPGDLRYIAGRGHDGGTCGGSSYALYTGPNTLPGLHFYVRQPGPGGVGVPSDAPSNASVFDNKWHLVAGTYDGTNVRLFVDGAQVGPAKPASGITYAAPIAGSMFYVDGYPPQANCFGNFDFPGQIDEVRVYDRALSSTELSRLAAAPGPAPPVLEPDAGPGPGPQPQVVGPSPNVAVSLAKLPALTAVKNLAILKLDTSGPVVETKIKIDGKAALTVPSSASYVGLSLNKPGDHMISATTIGAGGASASAATHIAATLGPSRAKFPESAISSSTIDLLTTAYENTQCVPDSTVTFGVVEATGCFRPLNPDGTLPPLERALAEEYEKINFIVEHEGKEFIPGGPGQFTTIKRIAADPAKRPFVTDRKLHINGMTVEPLGGASLVVFPAIQRMVSSNVRISYDGSILGSIPVQKSGPLNLDLTSGLKRFTDGNESLPLFSFDTSQAFHDIGGFPINGQVAIVFQKIGESRSTSLKVNVSLPDEITTAAGANPTARVELNADNRRGTYLGLLNIHLGEAFLGPVELANVDFTYNDAGSGDERCSRKWWKATAEVFFVPVDTGQGAGLKLAPPPERNGVAFCAGDFHSAGAKLQFGYPFLPPPVIFPGVTLNEIGLSFQLQKPVVVDGDVELKAAEIVSAHGGLLAAFATPGNPYTFKPGDAGGTVSALTGQTFSSTTFAVGGTVSVEPSQGIGLELGGAHLVYSYPGFIGAGGNAHLNTYLFVVNAGGSLELNTVSRRFNAVVHGEVCLLGGIKVAHVGACAGGEGHISSRGISVCFDILNGTWTPGVGYLYGAKLPEFFAGAAGYGCKPSRFWEENVRGARVSAAPNAPLVFRVKRGEKAKTVELTGAGGAPAVTVIGPDGERLASEADTMLHGKHLSAISAERFNRVWLGVSNAKPGTYRVVPAPGSPLVVNVRATRYEPNAGVKASVTGRGRHLVLHYDAGHATGRKVSFYERGKATWNLLKTVRGGRGKISFVPGFGPGGKRSIAAQVEVGGIPAPLQTLDRFKAPPPPRAGRVRQLRVSRRGGKLTVSWGKVPFSKSYSVVTEASGGAVRTKRVKAKRSRAIVKGIPAAEGGRVEVVAFGPLGDRGKPRRAKFKALRKPKSRLLAFKELGTGATERATKTKKSKGRKSKG